MPLSSRHSRLLIWGAVVVGFGLLLYALVRFAGSGSFGLPPITAADHIIGSPTSSIVLVEYSDFQCPACGAFHPFMKRLVKEMGPQFALVARHFPLQQHENAEEAARAAEAAAKQDKFWEMHDLLFERQNFWESDANPDAKFMSYAELLGLNTTTFKRDYESDEVKKIVTDSIAGAQRAAVDRTPTFFLNGKRLTNLPSTYDEFKKLIEGADAN